MAAPAPNPSVLAAEAALRDATRMYRAKLARNDLIMFNKVLQPDPTDIDNPEATRYEDQHFHRLLAELLQNVAAGKERRVIITLPPRHGKTQLVSRSFPAHVVGNDPYRSMIIATYNDDFAKEIGKDVRTIIDSAAFKQVFPGIEMRKGNKASERQQMEAGGILNFVGRGTSTTGRGGDILVLDDPIKDAQEADSPAIRNQCWNWFTKVLMTRRSNEAAPIIITLTRWHEDDIVGRLTDPQNPYFSPKFAFGWKIFNLPALAEDNDPLGRQPGEALWPGKFGVDFLESARQLDARGFSALYQQRPTPEDGDFFTKDMIAGYRLDQRPPLDQLRIYAASDHAVSVKQMNDRTCLLIVGVDKDNTIWLLDAFWKRVKIDLVVEQMIDMANEWKPLIWFAEGGQISKSILPFLRKRMEERKVWFTIVEQHPAADKMTRAQPIKGRMSNGKVRFPLFETWLENAKSELLKFPNDKHDDFVDALAHVGIGLMRLIAGKGEAKKKVDRPSVGTFAWVKWAANREKRGRENAKALGGM